MADENTETEQTGSEEEQGAEQEGSEEEENQEQEEELDPKELAAQLAKAQEALKKANREAKERREALEKIQRESEGEEEAKIRTAKEEVAAEWQDRFVKVAARGALVEAGVTIDPAKALRLLDLDDVEVDDSGDVKGLDVAVAALKKESPEFFKKKAPGAGDIADRKPAEEPKDFAEGLAAQLKR